MMMMTLMLIGEAVLFYAIHWMRHLSRVLPTATHNRAVSNTSQFNHVATIMKQNV